MTGIIAFVVTLVATLLNLGFGHDFLRQWLSAYALSWPIAACTAFFAIPVARRVTAWLTTKAEPSA